ncbi:2-amino-4-hydroxy-6-hydroxymethyldihydropteridine diphosphokinase [Zobellia nedashkovskayae]
MNSPLLFVSLLYIMSNPKTVYLSLGSNLGDTLNNLQDALFAINNAAGEVQKISHVYQTSSWGFESNDFMNICISLKTIMAPQELLRTLLDIETKLGNDKIRRRWVPP